MARARSIKPSLMANEELAALDPLTRLLFPYLWMLADREGRLEDRPRRIGAVALPYDQCADVHQMLEDLQLAGFIHRYVVQDIGIIQIINFAKHQTPHSKEVKSTLPAFDQSTTKVETKHDLGSAKASPRFSIASGAVPLTPDSGLLTADCGLPTADCGGAGQSADASPPHFSSEHQEFIKNERPDLDGPKTWLNFCEHYPADKRTSANWRKWVRREIRSPTTQHPPAPGATSDPDSRASVESLGMALGIGKWNEGLEHWAPYKARVRHKAAAAGAV